VIECLNHKGYCILGFKWKEKLVLFLLIVGIEDYHERKDVVEHKIIIKDVLFCIVDQPTGERFVVYFPQDRTVVISNDPNNITGLCHCLLIMTSLNDVEKKIAKTIINIIKKKEENKKRKKDKKITVEGIVKSR
jgi:hypothetical protein